MYSHFFDFLLKKQQNRETLSRIFEICQGLLKTTVSNEGFFRFSGKFHFVKQFIRNIESYFLINCNFPWSSEIFPNPMMAFLYTSNLFINRNEKFRSFSIITNMIHLAAKSAFWGEKLYPPSFQQEFLSLHWVLQACS